MSVNINSLPQSVGFRVPDLNEKKGLHVKLFEGSCCLVKDICKLAWFIFSIVVFPILLLRVAIAGYARVCVLPATYAFNVKNKQEMLERLRKEPKDIKEFTVNVGLRGVSITKRVVQTADERIDELEKNIKEINKLHQTRETFLSNHTATQITVQTADGVKIDTIQIMNDSPSKKWVVNFNANGICYEQILNELQEIANQTGANVYTGNYRGVMRSEGKIRSTNDLILDGDAMIEKLLADGVKEEDILIYGWSLGGAVGTEVASKHPNVHHINDRSFGDTMSFLQGLSGPVGTIMGALAWIDGWKFNSTANFQKIKGEKLVIYSKQDGLIFPKGSLYKCLKSKSIVPRVLKIKLDKEQMVKDAQDNDKSLGYLEATKLVEEKIKETSMHMYVLNYTNVREECFSFIKAALKLEKLEARASEE